MWSWLRKSNGRRRRSTTPRHRYLPFACKLSFDASVQGRGDDVRLCVVRHVHTWEPTAVMKCHRAHLEARCTERGYTLAEVLPCVVSQDGDEWTIDVDHPAYPRVSRLPEPAPIPTSGPGTELSKLLKRFGINPTPTCQCRAKQQQMDAWGPDEASRPERIDEVVAVMRAEAEARGLPFLDIAGRLLVRRAISNARRNA